MLPHALAEQLVIHGNRSVSRTKHRLIAPRFASNFFTLKTPLPRGAVLWNTIGPSNGPILDCTDMKSLLKKVVISASLLAISISTF